MNYNLRGWSKMSTRRKKQQTNMFTIFINNQPVCSIASKGAVEALKEYTEMYGTIMNESNVSIAGMKLNNGNLLKAVRTF